MSCRWLVAESIFEPRQPSSRIQFTHPGIGPGTVNSTLQSSPFTRPATYRSVFPTPTQNARFQRACGSLANKPGLKSQLCLDSGTRESHPTTQGFSFLICKMRITVFPPTSEGVVRIKNRHTCPWQVLSEFVTRNQTTPIPRQIHSFTATHVPFLSPSPLLSALQITTTALQTFWVGLFRRSPEGCAFPRSSPVSDANQS